MFELSQPNSLRPDLQAMTLAGAEYAIRRPQEYASDMLPAGLERVTASLGSSVRGQMIIGGLGSCESRLPQRDRGA